MLPIHVHHHQYHRSLDRYPLEQTHSLQFKIKGNITTHPHKKYQTRTCPKALQLQLDTYSDQEMRLISVHEGFVTPLQAKSHLATQVPFMVPKRVLLNSQESVTGSCSAT